MGYVRGNFWVLDPVYDEFLSLPCAKALHTAVRISRIRQSSISFDVRYSYITREYTCEAFDMWKPEKSANWYRTSIALGYGRHPLDAMIAAINLCDQLEQTPRIKACILECEVWLLNLAFKKAKLIEAKVEKALDTLADILKKLEPDEGRVVIQQGDVVLYDGPSAPLKAKPVKVTVNEMQRDNLARFFGKPALDEDDDL